MNKSEVEILTANKLQTNFSIAIKCISEGRTVLVTKYGKTIAEIKPTARQEFPKFSPKVPKFTKGVDELINKYTITAR